MTAPRHHAGLAGAAFLAALTGAAPALAQEQDRSDWPSSFTVGTASQGGTYFVYGSGMANLVAQELGLSGSAEVTGGPVHNAALIQTDQVDLGLMTLGPAQEALAGRNEVNPNVEHDKLRAIFPMYQSAFHSVALAGSGIESIADIPANASVGVGPVGGTPGTYWPRFYETLGIPITVQYGGAADLAGQLQDGLIEVFSFQAGLPFPAFSQVEAQNNVVFFGFTEDQVATLVENHPVSPFTIPADTYPSMASAQDSVSMWNFAVADADLSEGFIYAVVDAVMTNHDRMLEIHSAAEETVPENVDKNGILPWHPGAVRWFEENGYQIPDELAG